MNRNFVQAIMMSLVLAVSLPAPLVKAAEREVVRVGEADRYETAAKVATTNWSSPKNLVLVCGEGYADAVSASVLAKQLDAPILLTTPKSLNKSAKKALDTLKPENVYVIGGYASISKSVRSTLKDYKYNVVELSGKNRYETNIAVANELVKLGVKADNVMLVSGEGFSDALSVAPIAAAKGQILLLGNNSISGMKEVFNFVKDNKSNVTVIGTSYAINNSIFDKLGAVNRVNGGKNRFETNINVLNAFQGDLKTDKIFIANASKEGYADALVASSLAGKWSSNLVLVDGEGDSATSDAIDYIKSKMNEKTDLNIIGGTGVVSDNIVSKIKSTNTEEVPKKDEATVKSISANGLNQIKIVFNTAVDKDTAELLANYEIDGTKVDSTYETNASANLQDDRRTVLITFKHPFGQFKDVTFKLKNAVLSEDLANIITEYEQKVTFSSVNEPTVESLSVRGANKLIVKFSQPVRMRKDDLNLLKINKQSILNFSLNKTETNLLECSDVWVGGVELYFDSPLPEGDNTLSFPAGNPGQNFDDAAKMPLKETTLNFSVKPLQGMPKVKSVTSFNSETVYITYDRPMDNKTALEDSNYKINNKDVSVNLSDIYFEKGSNDTVVKIKNVGDLIKKGENTLVVKDNVTDGYGYAIKESNLTFNIGQDTIKPQVTSVSLIDNKVIRVKFNKAVYNGCATNKSNYKLIDNSDGEEITYKIDSIGGVSTVNGDNRDTYDIRFANNDVLKGSDYTITINSIYDTNSPPNVMDTYTGIIGGGEEKTKVTSIVKKVGSDRDIVIFFNKSMDESSITNPENYFFIDGTGETRKMPPNAKIAPGVGNKSVTITFSSSYVIGSGTSDRYIRKMGVANVKDKSGHMLDTVAYSDEISSNYDGGPSLIDGTSKLTYDGNNIKIKVSLTDTLDVISRNDFKVNGKTPDEGIIQDKAVILTFKSGVDKNSKIDSIREAGASTTISVSSGDSCDTAGRKMTAGSTTLLLPPITTPDSWVAKEHNSSITMHFNQDIDKDIKSSYYDDFIFKNHGTGEKLNVTDVIVDDNRNIIYKFDSGAMKVGDTIDVVVNDNPNNINIRGKERGKGNYGVLSPSKDDLTVKTVVVR